MCAGLVDATIYSVYRVSRQKKAISSGATKISFHLPVQASNSPKWLLLPMVAQKTKKDSLGSIFSPQNYELLVYKGQSRGGAPSSCYSIIVIS